jgi:hypothetical protein
LLLAVIVEVSGEPVFRLDLPEGVVADHMAVGVCDEWTEILIR